jgi:hypothetical protein
MDTDAVGTLRQSREAHSDSAFNCNVNRVPLSAMEPSYTAHETGVLQVCTYVRVKTGPTTRAHFVRAMATRGAVVSINEHRLEVRDIHFLNVKFNRRLHMLSTKTSLKWQTVADVDQ